jgi:CheY-like chemotaxis protein
MGLQKRIFIVDDDPFINMLVVKRFTAEGYIMEAFESGEECLKSLNKNPDLIILDYLFIPRENSTMNGMEVFDRIKVQNPDIPVIMLSGQENGEVVLELARKGIVDYIIKDNNLLDNLHTSIKEHFDRQV